MNLQENITIYKFMQDVIFIFEETSDREDKVEPKKLKRPLETMCNVVSAGSDHPVNYVQHHSKNVIIQQSNL